jgi:hypothetical protein
MPRHDVSNRYVVTRHPRSCSSRPPTRRPHTGRRCLVTVRTTPLPRAAATRRSRRARPGPRPPLPRRRPAPRPRGRPWRLPVDPPDLRRPPRSRPPPALVGGPAARLAAVAPGPPGPVARGPARLGWLRWLGWSRAVPAAAVPRGGRVDAGCAAPCSCSASALVLVLLGVAAVAFAYARTSIPDPNDAVFASRRRLSTTPTATTELGRFAAVDRTIVDGGEIPEHDPPGRRRGRGPDVLRQPRHQPDRHRRAAWGIVTREPAGGGSTITQQYVKNYFLTSDQTVGARSRRSSSR